MFSRSAMGSLCSEIESEKDHEIQHTASVMGFFRNTVQQSVDTYTTCTSIEPLLRYLLLNVHRLSVRSRTHHA